MERYDGHLKLTAKSVCDILKACSESNVSILKFGDLEVTFHGEHKEPLAVHDLPSADMLEQFQKQENESFERESYMTKQERLALMAIEDPSQYEELILAEELQDGYAQEA